MAQVMSDLASKFCVPCRGGVPPLKGEELASFEKRVDGWSAIDEHHITKLFKFTNFREALRFVNLVGEMAEEQGHHPDGDCQLAATSIPRVKARMDRNRT